MSDEANFLNLVSKAEYFIRKESDTMAPCKNPCKQTKHNKGNGKIINIYLNNRYYQEKDDGNWYLRVCCDRCIDDRVSSLQCGGGYYRDIRIFDNEKEVTIEYNFEPIPVETCSGRIREYCEEIIEDMYLEDQLKLKEFIGRLTVQ